MSVHNGRESPHLAAKVTPDFFLSAHDSLLRICLRVAGARSYVARCEDETEKAKQLELPPDDFEDVRLAAVRFEHSHVEEARRIAVELEELIQQALECERPDEETVSLMRYGRKSWRDTFSALTSGSEAKALQLQVREKPLTVCLFNHPPHKGSGPCLKVFPDRHNFPGPSPSGSMWTQFCPSHSNGNSRRDRRRTEVTERQLRRAERAGWLRAADSDLYDAASRAIFKLEADWVNAAPPTIPQEMAEAARVRIEARRNALTASESRRFKSYDRS